MTRRVLETLIAFLCFLTARVAADPDTKRDYYEVLGVPRDASGPAIRRAYKNIALQKHPDKNPGREAEAQADLVEVNNAYEVLKDSEKRAQYDEYGHSTPEEQMRVDPRSLFIANSDVIMIVGEREFRMRVQQRPAALGATTRGGRVAGEARGAWSTARSARRHAPLAPAVQRLLEEEGVGEGDDQHARLRLERLRRTAHASRAA